MSIRAITRLTGASKNTVAKLLADAGKACMAYHDEHVRNVDAVHSRGIELGAQLRVGALGRHDRDRARHQGGDEGHDPLHSARWAGAGEGGGEVHQVGEGERAARLVLEELLTVLVPPVGPLP